MIEGPKVYDPLTGEWSTGRWVVSDLGYWYPVWTEWRKSSNERAGSD